MGKALHITACQALGSYGVAWLLSAFTATAATTCLRSVLISGGAGWSVRRVLTDGSAEFKGDFDDTCRWLGIRHTRTKPRHAGTNGFDQRQQGTIRHEHWCSEFRRQYFTSRRAMQRS